MGRRGQAAMEFLMTYGWAILAAIIAIGVLAYFGVFTPGKYVGGTAIVNAPFYVNAWNIQAGLSTDGGVVLELRNNGGESFEIQSVEVAGCGTDSTSLNVSASALQSVTVNCAGGTGLTAGETFKGDITIKYRKSGSTVDLSSTGTIADTIVA